jgi:putative ABC transport system permease protein
LLMTLLLALATAALVVAAIGIHGLIAASVTERTREMGIRLALGATFGQALRTLALPGIVLAGTGTVAGLVGAAAAVPLIRHFVWGVSVGDPLTYAGVVALLLAVATVASVAPALRILRLDPATTLRQD